MILGFRILGFTVADGRTIWSILKMYLRDRYVGSALGIFWAVLNPVIMLAIYTFVFAFVFKTGAGTSSTYGHVVWLISGLVPYLAVSESFSTTASSVTGASSLVKNIVFNIDCLPIAGALVAAVPFLVGNAFLWILLIADGNYPTWHALILIPLAVLQFIFLAGIGFFLSALTVFIRDTVQVISTVLLVIIFTSPIFFNVEMLPPLARKVTFFNPFYQLVQPYREVLIHHRMPDLTGLAYLALLSGLLLFGGLFFFRRLKPYFTSLL